MTKNSQLALVNGEALTKADILSAIDVTLNSLNETNNPEVADNVLQILNRIEDASGLSKAKLLHGYQAWWKETGQDDAQESTFFDHIEMQDSQKAVYAKRLINVWEYQGKLPNEFRERSVKDQIPVCSAMKQGFEFSKTDLSDLVKTSSNGEVLELVRRVKGKPARKSSMQIRLERDGSLNAWKDNKKYFIGYLNVKEALDNPVIAMVIARIVDNSGIVEK